MITLLMVAALGQCGARASYGYARQAYAPTYYSAAPTYAAQTYYQQPAQQYYQAPQYNYSLVGDYMRQESAYEATVKQNAKLDALLDILTRQATPAPQPQPQFSAPYPSPQTPAKAPPVAQYEVPLPTKQAPQFEAYPSKQAPYEGLNPYTPSGELRPGFTPEKSAPTPPSPSPSFESSSWVPPPPPIQGGYGSQGGYGGFTGVAAMTQVMQRKCAQCHTGESERGAGVKLLELDGQLATIDPYLREIGKAVSGPSPRMPKEGTKLTPQELYAVLSGLQEYAATSRGRANVLASFGQ